MFAVITTSVDGQRVGEFKFNFVAATTHYETGIRVALVYGGSAIETDTVPVDDESPYGYFRLGDGRALFCRLLYEVTRIYVPEHVETVADITHPLRLGGRLSTPTEQARNYTIETNCALDAAMRAHGLLMWQHQLIMAVQYRSGYAGMAGLAMRALVSAAAGGGANQPCLLFME